MNDFLNKNYIVETRDQRMRDDLIQKSKDTKKGERQYDIWENMMYEQVTIIVPGENGIPPEKIKVRIDRRDFKLEPAKQNKTAKGQRSLKSTKTAFYKQTLLDFYPTLKPFKKQILESAFKYQYDPNILISAIIEASETYDVEPKLIASVMAVESNFNPYAKSPKSAYGLMQATEYAANQVKQEYNYQSAYDYKTSMRENILCGTAYLKIALKKSGNNKYRALTGYNAGLPAIGTNQKLPQETRDFAKKVLNMYENI